MKLKIAALITAALIIGIVLGATVTHAAPLLNKGWIRGDSFLDHPTTFQQGYVAGMADAVLHIAYNQTKQVDWTERAWCLDRDSGLTSNSTGYLSTLASWAERTLQSHPGDASSFHAASTLIIHACD